MNPVLTTYLVESTMDGKGVDLQLPQHADRRLYTTRSSCLNRDGDVFDLLACPFVLEWLEDVARQPLVV